MILLTERPCYKYWSQKDVKALQEAKRHGDLVVIAFNILKRMPRPRVQICGPITTGGKGSLEANIEEFNKAIFFYTSRGEYVFDQMPFQGAMEKLGKGVQGYDTRILDEFYLPIFKSGEIKKYKFLPDYESSRGAGWEHEKISILGHEIIRLLPNWYEL